MKDCYTNFYLKRIFYSKYYKYQLDRVYLIKTNIFGYTITQKYFSLCKNGVLKINPGYAWDGASGPAFDTSNVMRASLVHDALYQMMRMGVLDIKERKKADNLFREICKKDGMSMIRRKIMFFVIRAFGHKYATKKKRRLTIGAPVC